MSSNTDPFFTWQYNVKSEFKNKSIEQIKQTLIETSNPFAVLMTRINGDFNFGSVIRSANGFNAEHIFYYGMRKFDRRAAVGTYVYSSVKYLETFDQVLALKDTYEFVGLENTGKTNMLNTFQWSKHKKPLIILGEEQIGIPEEFLQICDRIVEIPMSGSVPSFNVASAATVAMYDFMSKNVWK